MPANLHCRDGSQVRERLAGLKGTAGAGEQDCPLWLRQEGTLRWRGVEEADEGEPDADADAACGPASPVFDGPVSPTDWPLPRRGNKQQPAAEADATPTTKQTAGRRRPPAVSRRLLPTMLVPAADGRKALASPISPYRVFLLQGGQAKLR